MDRTYVQLQTVPRFCFPDLAYHPRGDPSHLHSKAETKNQYQLHLAETSLRTAVHCNVPSCWKPYL